jgi:hypothetical protein
VKCKIRLNKRLSGLLYIGAEKIVLNEGPDQSRSRSRVLLDMKKNLDELLAKRGARVHALFNGEELFHGFTQLRI